jgi:hypothetical protein
MIRSWICKSQARSNPANGHFRNDCWDLALWINRGEPRRPFVKIKTRRVNLAGCTADPNDVGMKKIAN